LEADGGEAGVGRAEEGDGGLALVGGFGFCELDGLSQFDFGGEDDEGAVGADGDAEGLFGEGLMIRRLAADNERNIEQHAFAAALFVDRHGDLLAKRNGDSPV